jgi:hypothetical protein
MTLAISSRNWVLVTNTRGRLFGQRFGCDRRLRGVCENWSQPVRPLARPFDKFVSELALRAGPWCGSAFGIGQSHHCTFFLPSSESALSPDQTDNVRSAAPNSQPSSEMPRPSKERLGSAQPSGWGVPNRSSLGATGRLPPCTRFPTLEVAAFALVTGRTEQLQVLDGVSAAEGPGNDVIVLNIEGSSAFHAAASVPGEYRFTDFAWDRASLTWDWRATALLGIQEYVRSGKAAFVTSFTLAQKGHDVQRGVPAVLP